MNSKSKWFARIGVVALLILAMIIGINSTVSAQTNLITNPGLETGVGQTPTGWSESGGNLSASKSEGGNPHSGSYKGTHWLSSSYNVNTYQTKTGLTNGTYTLRSWVMSGGGQSTAVMKAENCGGSTQTMNIPTTSTWVQITMTVSVTNGQCTVGFSSVASANQWLNFDDVEFFMSGSSPTSTPTSSGCTPTTITPYVQINGGAWQQTSSASVSVGDSVKFGPQPTDSNGWSWSGPNGFNATTREVTISNVQTYQAGDYTASYTNGSGCTSYQTFNVTVSGGSGPTSTPTPTSVPSPTPTSSGCTPTTITPYVQINGGTWQQTASASVNTGDSVKFGPQPVDSSGWSWSGPNGFNATTREVTISNIQTNQAGNYIASYTNSSGCTGSQTFSVTVSGSGPTPTRTPTPTGGGSGLTMRGADTSSLRRALDLGQTFKNASGVTQDPLVILKNVGVNYVRLRVWNNPASGYNNKAKVLQDALYVKSQGLQLMIDFHYSDTWADPGKQFKPSAWNGHNISQLQTDVYNFTYDVCNSLKAQGTTPDSVQVGNEITPGMLFEEGRIVNNDFTNLSLLVKAGYNAVKACNSSTQVVLHIDRGGDNAASRWWFDGMQAKGVNWDITGLSFYCYWHGTIPTMQNNVADMKARYGKPVILAETAYLFTTANGDSEGNSNNSTCSGYPASQTGQANNFYDVQSAAKAGGAIGVFYWEPTWVATSGNGWDPANINGTGSGWDNQAVFDFNFRLNPNIQWIQ